MVFLLDYFLFFCRVVSDLGGLSFVLIVFFLSEVPFLAEVPFLGDRYYFFLLCPFRGVSVQRRISFPYRMG